jgi:hypothetical protein
MVFKSQTFGLLFENEDQLVKLIEEVNQELRKRAKLVSKIERSKVKNKNIQVNQKKVTKLLDNMLDFLAEMPVDKYHNYREFRNLRLRQYLIYKFMQEKYSGKAAL